MHRSTDGMHTATTWRYDSGAGLPAYWETDMGRNEFDANRALAGSRNAWAPVRAPRTGLRVSTVLAWAGVALAASWALSALGVV